MTNRVESLVELIRLTSTSLPDDVTRALEGAAKREESPTAIRVLETILENVRLSRETSSPVCQDTGTPLFYITHPIGESTRSLRREIEEAVREATRLAILRPNAVDPITGKNSGDNTGTGFPYCSFAEVEGDELRITLLLKGGGSENVGIQYRLPDESLKAGRDLEGVRKCIIDAAYRAQGKGCPPGILGVSLGGDRGSGYHRSKVELLRPIDDRNEDPALARLEERCLDEINRLDIGPMGLGGRTTLLGIKIGALHRLPACYFVTVSYLCWAARRHTLTFRNGEITYD